jgi:hypothetical protein
MNSYTTRFLTSSPHLLSLRRIAIVCVLFISVIAIGSLGASKLQAQDANAIMQNVVKKFQQVRDYTANATITLDIDFVKAPPAKATLLFKQPSLFKIKSTDFAMLPKQSMNISPLGVLQGNNFTAISAGSAMVNGVNCAVVRVFPNVDTGDVVASKMYVDVTNNLILKSESTTKKNGTVVMILEYGSAKSFGLPSKMTMTFDVPEFKLPKSMSGDISNNEPKKPRRTNGSVIVACSDYQINKGIPDSTFK